MANMGLDKIGSILSSVEISTRAGISRFPAPIRAFLEPLVKPDFMAVLSRNVKAPRIGLYGAVGSGKPGIINAIMNERVLLKDEENALPVLLEYTRDTWPIKFVDIPTAEGWSEFSRTEQVIEEIIANKIDILLVAKPAENFTFSQDDITFLLLLREAYLKQLGIELPIILVANKADPDNEIPISLDSISFLTNTYVPVCTTWNNRVDDRYNIEELVMAVYDKLPEVSKVSYAAGSSIPSLKISLAKNITWTTSLVAAAVCFAPLPGADAASIYNFQVNLVDLVGRIGGKSGTGKNDATDFVRYLRPYGISDTMNMVTNQFAKITGPLGLPISLTTAANAIGSTLAIGEAAISYYIEGAKIEKTKDIFAKEDERYKTKFKKGFSIRANRNNPAEGFIVFKRVGDEYKAGAAPVYLVVER
ncbi:hypothetical protein [Candidatus Chlorohelix sp.]|uniref:hypothetical protein n=1 Tax=Candidatus Chlorohelix sp. TaxID=3139201 RepID=UPI003064ED5E